MEHSKEFYTKQFLRNNDYKHVKLQTINTIIRLYKLFKQKNKNTHNQQLLKAFSEYIDNIEPNKHEENTKSQIPYNEAPPPIEVPTKDCEYGLHDNVDISTHNIKKHKQKIKLKMDLNQDFDYTLTNTSNNNKQTITLQPVTPMDIDPNSVNYDAFITQTSK